MSEKHGEALVLENEAHRDAGGRTLERHAPASISASEVPHTVAIEDEAVRLGDLRTRCGSCRGIHARAGRIG